MTFTSKKYPTCVGVECFKRREAGTKQYMYIQYTLCFSSSMEIVTREEPSLDWRLAQPTLWATLSSGVRIQQLLPDKFDEVAELIRVRRKCQNTSRAFLKPISFRRIYPNGICDQPLCLTGVVCTVRSISDEPNKI